MIPLSILLNDQTHFPNGNQHFPSSICFSFHFKPFLILKSTDIEVPLISKAVKTKSTLNKQNKTTNKHKLIIEVLFNGHRLTYIYFIWQSKQTPPSNNFIYSRFSLKSISVLDTLSNIRSYNGTKNTP